MGLLVLVAALAVFQRKLLYYPTHHGENNGLSEWRHDGNLLGYAREVKSPQNVWLMLHGNAGQASDRTYAIPSFSRVDSVFVLEYPGYGLRSGTPSMAAFNSAAKQAYAVLRSRFPNNPVCVVGESIGSGPASVLGLIERPPDKIVLITPFDMLARVAADHFRFLPAGVLLLDNWDNISALKQYRGPVEIFGAAKDEIIGIAHAKALAASKPSSKFHLIDGGHNEWAMDGRVWIQNP